MVNGNHLRVATCAGLLGILLASAVVGASPIADRGAQRDALGDYASTQIIVRFAPAALAASTKGSARADLPRPHEQNQNSPGDAGNAHGPVGTSPNPSVALRAAWNRWGVTRIRRLHSSQFANPQAAARYGLDRTYLLEVPEGTDTWAMAAALSAFGDEIEIAEVDGIGEVAGGFIPDDALFSSQYSLHNEGQTGGLVDADIDAPEAWKMHTGDIGTVTVGIVDTGVTPHAEFLGRMVQGINTVDPLNPDVTTDNCWHGTHIAGIVAAAGNNGVGIAGVTWGANIMPVKVFEGCSGRDSDTAEGIIWAVDHDADVLNISLQFCTGSSTFRSAIDYANDQGVLVVSAAGNNNGCGNRVVAFPARFPNSMAVSGTNDEDEFATFSNTSPPLWSSNFGDEIDVCAPGDRIRSTWPGGTGYEYLNATSTATPHVAGLAALLKSFEPNLTNDEIRYIITSTADDLGPEGWDDEYGYGRINAYSALLVVGPPRIVGSLPPDGAIDARQPSDPDGSNAVGWLWVDLLLSGDISGVTKDGFTVSQDGGVGSPPFVLAVQPLQGEYNIRVILSSRISVRAWTTITHIDSDTSVRLGYLPPDVNGDGLASEADIVTIIDVLNGVIDPLPIWSTDLDRSGATSPSDILRGIDLLNGAEQYDSFIGEMLPP